MKVWQHWQIYDIVRDINQVVSAASCRAKPDKNLTENPYFLLYMVLLITPRLKLCSTEIMCQWWESSMASMFYKKKKKRMSGGSVMMWGEVACSHPLILTTNIKLSNNVKSTDRHSHTVGNIQKTTDEHTAETATLTLSSNLAEGNTTFAPGSFGARSIYRQRLVHLGTCRHILCAPRCQLHGSDVRFLSNSCAVR